MSVADNTDGNKPIPNEDTPPPVPLERARAKRRAPERIPPHNLEAERSLLGACLLDGAAIDAAVDAGLQPASFFKPAHASIFSVCVDLRAADPYGKQPADLTTVGDRLVDDPALEQVGGKKYLFEMTADTPVISNAPRYARLVAARSKLRGLIGVAGEIAELAYSDPDDVEAVEQAALRLVTAAGVAPSALVDAVESELGDRALAIHIAGDVATRMRSEQATAVARRIIRDEQVAREADLATIIPINVGALLEQDRPDRTPMFGALLAEGHNATIVARWKVGKSTFVDNAAISAATGGMFLARFDTLQPRRVVLFNYELHDDDMADRLDAMAMPPAARENIVIVNLRGRRLPIHTPAGRDLAVRILQDNGAELWIVDPFGAAYAASGGEDENNNAEVRRFLIALDEIKRLSGCSTLLMPVHTGRKTDADGDEQGRGATVLEDWPDVRMLLTRGKHDQSDQRFLRTEGRAWELEESRLTFDETTRRLTLPNTDIGISRKKAKSVQNARAVLDIARVEPGATRGRIAELLDEHGITNNTEKADAIKAARTLGLVHFHEGKQRAQHHYEGPVHPDADPCPGGHKP